MFTFRTRDKYEVIIERPGPYGGATGYTSPVRDQVGEGSVRASVNSDSAGTLYLEGAFLPTGPWVALFTDPTIVDPITGLNVADFSVPTAGRRYVRVRYDCAPNPIGVNFDIAAYMTPTAP